MQYSIATNWDERLISRFKKLNLLHKDKIIELFNSLSFGSEIPTLKISRTEAERKIELIKRVGFEFNYLINSSIFPNLSSAEGSKRAIEYISWIKKQGVDIVTLGNEKILSFIWRNFSDLKVNISIVLGLKTIKEVNRLRKKYPNIVRITLHQMINRDKNKLIQHIINAREKDGLKPIEVELLANEICLYNCPLMKKHYRYAPNVQGLVKFENWCAKTRASDPLQFLNACWIRPEDVEIYEKLGVDILKIAGKTESTIYLIRVAEAFMKRRYLDNIMDLFYSDWWPSRKKPFIDNIKLNGFIEYLWSKKLKKVSAENINPKYNLKYKYE